MATKKAAEAATTTEATGDPTVTTDPAAVPAEAAEQPDPAKTGDAEDVPAGYVAVGAPVTVPANFEDIENPVTEEGSGEEESGAGEDGEGAPAEDKPADG